MAKNLFVGPTNGTETKKTPFVGPQPQGYVDPNATKQPTQKQSTYIDPATYDATKYKASTYTANQLGDPTQWKVDDSQLVSGQLNGILAQNSALMQASKTAGLQAANGRGLLNSSMAVGAAQDSMIKNALPIAQGNADVTSKAASYNADAANKFAMENNTALNQANQFNASALNDASKTNAAATNAADQYNANATNAANEYNATNAFTKQQDLFKANVEASMEQLKAEHEWDAQSQRVYGTLMQDFQDKLVEINRDTNMDQQTKDWATKQIYDWMKASLTLLPAVNKMDYIGDLLKEDDSFTPAPTGTTVKSGGINYSFDPKYKYSQKVQDNMNAVNSDNTLTTGQKTIMNQNLYNMYQVANSPDLAQVTEEDKKLTFPIAEKTKFAAQFSIAFNEINDDSKLTDNQKLAMKKYLYAAYVAANTHTTTTDTTTDTTTNTTTTA